MIIKTKFKPIVALACLFLVMLALFCVGNMEADAAFCHNEFMLRVSMATCTEDGYVVFTCTVCGKEYDSRYDDEAKQYLVDYPYFKLESTGHTYDNEYDSNCNICNEWRETEPHDHIEEIIPAVPVTCTSNGFTEGKKCSDCGLVLVEQIMIPKGHRYDDELDGDCSVCGYLRELTIAQGTCGIDWRLTNYGILYIDGSGKMTDYSSTNFYPWHDYCSLIASVEIGDSVTGIAENAFDDCRELEYIFVSNDNMVYTSINGNLYTKNGKKIVKYAIGKDELTFIIPNSVTSIGGKAFLNCSNLLTVTIPESVTEINSFAFAWCDRLTRIIVPNSVKNIGTMAFSHCSGLENVTIGENVTIIGAHAFSYCSSLQNIIIPDNVKSLGQEVFAYCDNLKSITIGKGVEVMGDYLFRECINLENVILNNSIIGNCAFLLCDSLSYIYIPDSVTSIGTRALGGCRNLENITVSENNAVYKSIDGNLYTKSGKKLIQYAIGKEATSFSIPEGVVNISSYSFGGARNLCKLFISDSVKTVESYAFSNCTKLFLVDIGDGVTNIGDYAFHVCWGLVSVTLGKNVTNIGTDVFRESRKLVELINHSSLDIIKGSSDYGYIGMYVREIHSGESKVVEAGDYLFYKYINGINYLMGYKGTDTEIELPDNYNNEKYQIGHYAFNHCEKLESVRLSSGVTAIGQNAFAGCKTLKNLFISKSVEKVYQYAFQNSSNLASVTFEATDGWKVIGSSLETDISSEDLENSIVAAEYLRSTYCKNVWERKESTEELIAEGKCGEETYWKLLEDGTLVIYGNGSTEDYLVNIAKDQPYRAYASQITKVVIEEGILSIGRGAFYGFTAITEVVLPDSLIAIHEYAFFGCSGIQTLTVPENVFYIGAMALRKTGLTALTFENAEGWAFSGGVVPDTDNAVKAFTSDATYKQTCIRAVSEVGEVVASGVFGKNGAFSWTLTETGVLTVSGAGNMPKFNVNTTPWYGYRGAIRSVVIGEGITSVGRCSFHTCRAIASITLPESLETISEYAFYNCQLLSEVTIPANVTGIELYAFRKCFELKNVEFIINYGWSAGDGKISATELNSNAAEMLTLVSYTEIWIRDVNAEEEALDPNYVTGGACNTFTKWTLTYTDDTKTKMKLTVSGSGVMPEYGTGAAPWYGYLNDIVEIEVQEGVTVIGRCAFYGLKFVTKVTLCEGLTSIGDYAFNGCFSLKSIEIPASVTYIADTAFTKTGLGVIPTV